MITPDGSIDTEVIPAEGGWEIANVNPSWSPDGRSLLVHTGGWSEGTDTDISIAQRDAAGVWSHRAIVGGRTSDYHPSWSNSGTQFSFIRVVEGSNPEKLVLMVADADGSSVHSVSHGRGRRSRRSAGRPMTGSSGPPGPSTHGADRTFLLIPVDGSPVVEIPAPGGASKGTCQMQRVAP